LRLLKWVFPIGAILNVGGVFLYALLEKHSFEDTQDWEFAVLSKVFIPSLLIGTLLAIVGSFFDRQRLLVAQTRVRGYLQATTKSKRLAHGKLVDAILPGGVLSGSKSTLIH
jgi:hypothetical protein